LLFDEAEDFFYKPNLFSTKSNSKMFTNYLLENNPVPVIWTSNHVSYLDPAYIRRFTHIVNFKKMPKEFSLKLWKKVNKKMGLNLPLQKLKNLNQEFDIAPSEITKALQFAAFTDQSEQAIESNLQGKIKAIRGVKANNRTTHNDFKFVYNLTHTDIDLKKFVNQVQIIGNLNFSLCLYGEPGTGKSAFARELAEKLNLKVIQKRASEIQSMWLGQTEKNIAAAFEQAEEEKALLIFDEADSFLQDRKKAHRSWEISQVNEMLTRMESHPLPFICTTNLMDSLDQASLRRFIFKIEFKPMQEKQIEQAFYNFFKLKPKGKITGIIGVTAGDFAVVKKKAKYLNLTKNEKELLRLLKLELELKNPQKIQPIGFSNV